MTTRSLRIPCALSAAAVAAGIVAMGLHTTLRPAAAQELPEGVIEVTTVEGITEYRLDNGLRFLLFPDQSKQQITVNITYLVGSRHEGYGETGMAHLLEHLVFKGTPNHPDIPAELSERGASPNGTTWVDRTNYFETFPANEDNLEWALDLEADRMVNSFISAEDLESEMTVVRNEWESGENSPLGVLQKRVMSAAFDWHNYGNSTIGARSDLENVPIGRLQAFYRKYYQPDNAVLVVAGRFEPEVALRLVAEKFGVIPRPDRTGASTLFETYTAEPAQDGERTVTLRRVGDTQLVMAAWHIPSGAHEHYAALDVMSHILNTAPAGRLYQNLVETGLAANAAAASLQLNEPGVLFALAEVREEGSLPEAADAMFATLDELTAEPPTEEEVERAKTDYLSRIELSLNNPQGIALDLSEWAARGDWRLFFLHRDRLEGVTPEAVHQVAQAYIKESNRTVGYYYPTEETPARAEIPAPPDIEALVAGYTGGEAVAEGEAFDPTPENIDARTVVHTLSNGTEVAFLQKENRGDAVRAGVTFRHGSEETLRGVATAASLTGSMLMRGTNNRTRQEINDDLDRLRAQGGVSGGLSTVSANFSTVRENLHEVLRLAAEVMMEPAFPEEEFDQLRDQRLAGIESQRSEPTALVSQALTQHMSQHQDDPDHPNYAADFDEQIARLEAVTIDDIRDFWSSFHGGAAGTIAVVGDFDPEATLAVLEELFGGWEAAQPFERLSQPFVERETVRVDIEAPDKANAMMIALHPFAMTDEHPDYPAMVMADYMLGGGFLNSRLATRIRQEEGLSYGVGSQLGVQTLDDDAALVVFAIFAPENGDKVVVAFEDEMNKALQAGFTEEELEAAKRGYLDNRQNGRANDQSVASSLRNNLYLDRTMAFTAEFEAAVEALTLEDVNSALRRHVSVEGFSVFRGGDFANKLVP